MDNARLHGSLRSETGPDVSLAGFDWIRSAPAMINSFGADGRIWHVSDLWLSKLGYERDDVIGANAFDFFVPPFQLNAEDTNLALLLPSESECDVEWMLRCKSANTLDVLVSVAMNKSACGEPLGLHVITDISARKLTERRLFEREARYRLLAEQSMDMLFQLDENLVWRYASPACHEITGYNPELIIGNLAFQRLHPDEAERVRQGFADVAAGREQQGSFVYRVWHAECRWIWVETRFRSTTNAITGQPTGLVGTLRDVTTTMEFEERLAEANQKLEIMASHDALTELYNRRAFEEIIDREIKISARKGTKLTLFMIDVDWFKAYNDRYGHPEGDIALRHVSGAIRQSIRRPADIAARYGGEEFVVLLPDTDETGAHTVASAVRSSVEALQLAHASIAYGVLTVSIGVAVGSDFARAKRSKRDLLKEADKALYLAKGKGRNTIVFWS